MEETEDDTAGFGFGAGVKKSSDDSPNADHAEDFGGDDPSFANALSGSDASGSASTKGFDVCPVL